MKRHHRLSPQNSMALAAGLAAVTQTRGRVAAELLKMADAADEYADLAEMSPQRRSLLRAAADLLAAPPD